MRYWILFCLAVLVLVAGGCTSSVHPAARDYDNAPTADTGVLANGTSTTGGDAAGSLNLPQHKEEKHEGGH